jgi:hypothetical protein
MLVSLDDLLGLPLCFSCTPYIPAYIINSQTSFTCKSLCSGSFSKPLIVDVSQVTVLKFIKLTASTGIYLIELCSDLSYVAHFCCSVVLVWSSIHRSCFSIIYQLYIVESKSNHPVIVLQLDETLHKQPVGISVVHRPTRARCIALLIQETISISIICFLHSKTRREIKNTSLSKTVSLQ